MPEGGYVARILGLPANFTYVTEAASTEARARLFAAEWLKWADNVLLNTTVETVYYILAVPLAWPGPNPGAHPYAGLEIKIGRAKDVMKRFENLRTGTASKLIIHALEPGGSEVEQRRHQQFLDERRQGEWFACTPRLFRHVYRTWERNSILPPEHQREVVTLQHRIDAYIATRQILGGAPDLVNPSLVEPWIGERVFIDLTYAMPFGVGRKVRRKGRAGP